MISIELKRSICTLACWHIRCQALLCSSHEHLITKLERSIMPQV